MSRKSNQAPSKESSYRPARHSVTIGQAQIRLIQVPDVSATRGSKANATSQTSFVPGGSYQPERFPELERLKQEFLAGQGAEHL